MGWETLTKEMTDEFWLLTFCAADPQCFLPYSQEALSSSAGRARGWTPGETLLLVSVGLSVPQGPRADLSFP